MTHIALCDDDKNAVPVIAGAARSAFQSRGFDVRLDCFSAGRELLAALEKCPYDLVLLDIDMPELDGIEVGKRVKAYDHAIPVVFVSECEDRVFESFSVQPLGFVRKSNFLNDIAAVVELYEKYREMTQSAEHVEFSAQTSLISLKIAHIRYMEGSRNYQLVFLMDEEKPIEIKMTMEKLEEKMKPYGFIRIHKGYLVNYRFIRRIRSRSVELDDGRTLPIGRDRLDNVRERYLALMKWKGLSPRV